MFITVKKKKKLTSHRKYEEKKKKNTDPGRGAEGGGDGSAHPDKMGILGLPSPLRRGSGDRRGRALGQGGVLQTVGREQRRGL